MRQLPGRTPQGKRASTTMTEHQFENESWQNPTHLTHDPLNPGEICPHGFKHPSPHPCPECGYAAAAAIELLTYQIGNDAYRISQRSQHEGALFAWERLTTTGWEVVGCICHTTPLGYSLPIDAVVITRNWQGSIDITSRAGTQSLVKRGEIEEAVVEHIKAVL